MFHLMKGVQLEIWQNNLEYIAKDMGAAIGPRSIVEGHLAVESTLRSACLGRWRAAAMRVGLVIAACIGALLAAAGLSQCRRTVRSVVGGVAVWNHDRAVVIINSKSLIYRGSVLKILFGAARQSAGIPSEPSKLSLESVVARIGNERVDSTTHPFAISGVTVVGDSVLGNVGDGNVVQIDLGARDLAPATPEQRHAFWRSYKDPPFKDGNWSADVRFGGRWRLEETVMQLSDGVYHVTAFPSDGVWTYRVLERGVSAVIATVDENPRWSCDP